MAEYFSALACVGIGCGSLVGVSCLLGVRDRMKGTFLRLVLLLVCRFHGQLFVFGPCMLDVVSWPVRAECLHSHTANTKRCLQ